jgi:two-component system, chemotaxis family, CheB/CheR fusion protein
VDAEAVRQARWACYHPWSVRMVPATLLERYFIRDQAHCAVREELRRVVVVGHHNLLTDAPLPRIDLLLCRNVLIYLNMAAQEYVVRQLRGALAKGGVLVLGKTELAVPAEHGLRWLSKRHRIAAKAPDISAVTASHWQDTDSAYA